VGERNSGQKTVVLKGSIEISTREKKNDGMLSGENRTHTGRLSVGRGKDGTFQNGKNWLAALTLKRKGMGSRAK